MTTPRDDESFIGKEYTIGGVKMGREGFDESNENREISDIIRRTLDDSRAVDASNVGVSVTNGKVTLSGAVESQSAIQLAEITIEHIEGVRGVINELTVMSSDDLHEWQIKKRREIESQDPSLGLS
jgi:osmotically-inducible protein OsmY